MGKIKIEGYICERCWHKWIPRGEEEPRVCPKCKSPYWNKPRKNKRAFLKRNLGKKERKRK